MTAARPDFECDPYIEHLLYIRETDVIRFRTLPRDVIELVEQYEREKKAHVAKSELKRG